MEINDHQEVVGQLMGLAAQDLLAPGAAAGLIELLQTQLPPPSEVPLPLLAPVIKALAGSLQRVADHAPPLIPFFSQQGHGQQAEVPPEVAAAATAALQPCLHVWSVIASWLDFGLKAQAPPLLEGSMLPLCTALNALVDAVWCLLWPMLLSPSVLHQVGTQAFKELAKDVSAAIATCTDVTLLLLAVAWPEVEALGVQEQAGAAPQGAAAAAEDDCRNLYVALCGGLANLAIAAADVVVTVEPQAGAGSQSGQQGAALQHNTPAAMRQYSNVNAAWGALYKAVAPTALPTGAAQRLLDPMAVAVLLQQMVGYLSHSMKEVMTIACQQAAALAGAASGATSAAAPTGPQPNMALLEKDEGAKLRVFKFWMQNLGRLSNQYPGVACTVWQSLAAVSLQAAAACAKLNGSDPVTSTGGVSHFPTHAPRATVECLRSMLARLVVTLAVCAAPLDQLLLQQADAQAQHDPAQIEARLSVFVNPTPPDASSHPTAAPLTMQALALGAAAPPPVRMLVAMALLQQPMTPDVRAGAIKVLLPWLLQVAPQCMYREMLQPPTPQVPAGAVGQRAQHTPRREFVRACLALLLTCYASDDPLDQSGLAQTCGALCGAACSTHPLQAQLAREALAAFVQGLCSEELRAGSAAFVRNLITAVARQVAQLAGSEAVAMWAAGTAAAAGAAGGDSVPSGNSSSDGHGQAGDASSRCQALLAAQAAGLLPSARAGRLLSHLLAAVGPVAAGKLYSQLYLTHDKVLPLLSASACAEAQRHVVPTDPDCFAVAYSGLAGAASVVGLWSAFAAAAPALLSPQAAAAAAGAGAGVPRCCAISEVVGRIKALKASIDEEAGGTPYGSGRGVAGSPEASLHGAKLGVLLRGMEVTLRQAGSAMATLHDDKPLSEVGAVAAQAIALLRAAAAKGAASSAAANGAGPAPTGPGAAPTTPCGNAACVAAGAASVVLHALRVLLGVADMFASLGRSVHKKLLDYVSQAQGQLVWLLGACPASSGAVARAALLLCQPSSPSPPQALTHALLRLPHWAASHGAVAVLAAASAEPGTDAASLVPPDAYNPAAPGAGLPELVGGHTQRGLGQEAAARVAHACGAPSLQQALDQALACDAQALDGLAALLQQQQPQHPQSATTAAEQGQALLIAAGEQVQAQLTAGCALLRALAAGNEPALPTTVSQPAPHASQFAAGGAGAPCMGGPVGLPMGTGAGAARPSHNPLAALQAEVAKGIASASSAIGGLQRSIHELVGSVRQGYAGGVPLKTQERIAACAAVGSTRGDLTTLVSKLRDAQGQLDELRAAAGGC